MTATSPLPALETTLDDLLAASAAGPPRLAAALRHAVFPGGMRVRPRLCLAVAAACGSPGEALVLHAAAAVELLHCASLVHDDLPCFDDSALRRGRPSVHALFGEALAVLAGDGLIVLAFEALANAPGAAATRVFLLRRLAAAAGVPGGLVAGQGWESEQTVPLAAYHRAKTASLFTLAAALGAAAVGAPAEPWEALGMRLGEAYQIADDLRDATLDSASLGKPAGRDAALGRPNALAALGGRRTLERVEALVRGALDAIPPCPGRAALAALIGAEMARLLPAELVLRVAA